MWTVDEFELNGGTEALLVNFNEQPSGDYQANRAGSLESQSVVEKIKVQRAPAGNWYWAFDFLRTGGNPANDEVIREIGRTIAPVPPPML